MKQRSRKPTTKRRGFTRRVEYKPHAQEPDKKQVLPISQTITGVVVKTRYGFSLDVANRRDKNEYVVRGQTVAAELEGQLVAAKRLPSTKRGRQEIEITQQLGDPADPLNISLMAILSNEIPHIFPDEVVKEANAFKEEKWETAEACAREGGKGNDENGPNSVMPAKAGIPFNNSQRKTKKGSRTDLRTIPFITIDGKDAKDFDDAVFAEHDGKGWHIIVAIADVAHYVKAGSALDQEAYLRGNSTYFPDRVVPMLPEALSNNLCSLMPKMDRACMAVHIWITAQGKIKKYEFVRGVMYSQARLTYEEIQKAKEGAPTPKTKALLKDVIEPLYGAYECLLKARQNRGTLELDLPERHVVLAKDGTVKTIGTRERLDSHRLIEEFMILANVAAAAALEGKPNHCMYRVHDKPSEEKLESLRQFLSTIDISLVPAKQLQPRVLTQILNNVAGTDKAKIVSEVMLRSQSQAIYSPQNSGHFGLALGQYAHFTSPIRRYADLLVHRALIRICDLGDDGLTDREIKHMEEYAEHISATERRSITAERDAVDRYVALFMENKIDSVFEARVSGVARFGLFVQLNETGAEGIVPFNALPRDYYVLDEAAQALVGERYGKSYQLAQTVTVRLEKTDRLTGSMQFSIIEENKATPLQRWKKRKKQ